MKEHRLSGCAMALMIFVGVLAAVTLALNIMLLGTYDPAMRWLYIVNLAMQLVYHICLFMLFQRLARYHDTRPSRRAASAYPAAMAWIALAGWVLAYIGPVLLTIIAVPSRFHFAYTRLDHLLAEGPKFLACIAIPLLMCLLALGKGKMSRGQGIVVCVCAAGGLAYQLVQLFLYFSGYHAGFIAQYGQLMGVLLANVNLLNLVVLFYIAVFAYYNSRVMKPLVTARATETPGADAGLPDDDQAFTLPDVQKSRQDLGLDDDAPQSSEEKK